MLGQYLPIVAMVVLAGLFAAGSFLASHLLSPIRRTAPKVAPYECGIVPTTDNPERFPVRFYLIAMIFIVFDVEIIFMYPWATVFADLGLFGLVAIGIFSFMVFESFVYLIGHGALEWGPIKRIVRHEAVNPERTAGSTIRRVGLDGRFDGPMPEHGEAA